jgi:hypothetical protein
LRALAEGQNTGSVAQHNRFLQMLERKISSHMQISGNTPVLCRKNARWLQAGGWSIAAARQQPQITLSKAPDFLVKLR